MQSHLIPHLLRKDLRHVLVPLLLWALLLIIQAVLVGTGISSNSPFDFVKQMLFLGISLLVPVLQGILTFIIIPLVVQDEPLVGSTSHWLTRPISRVTLLAEKALFFVGLLVIPPLLINLVIFAVNGVSAHDMLAAIPQLLISSLNLICFLMLAASLTSSFGKYALWLAGIWIVMIIIGGIGKYAQMIHRNPDELMMGLTNYTLPLSQAIASSVFAIIAATALIASQYLTRRTRQNASLAILGLCLTIAIQMFWPIDFLESPAKEATYAAFTNGDVKLTIDPDSIGSSEQLQFRTTDVPETAITAQFKITGLPPGYQLGIHTIDAKWIIPNKENLESHVYISDFSRFWITTGIEGILNGPKLMNQSQDSSSLRSQIFTLKTAKYRELKSEQGDYQGTAKIKVIRYSIVGEVPLQKGERIDYKSNHVNIVSVLQETAGCRIVLHESMMNLWFSGNYGEKSSYLESMANMTKSTSTYLLVNRARGEAFIEKDLHDIDLAETMLTATSPLVNKNTTIEFASKDNEPVIDEAWLAGATLVKLQKITEGSYTTVINAKDLPLSPIKK